MNQASGRLRLGISPEADGVVLSLGNIREYNGIDMLLHAFARVAETRPRAMLVIAGKPWVNWRPYDQLIDDLGLRGNVHLHLDFVPANEVEVYFEALDVVVLPCTRFDAQSAVGALALPFGKPLIVSDVGGLPELVGAPEAVMPRWEAEALAAALILPFRDSTLRQCLAAESLKLARELRWGPISEATRQIYREMSGSDCEACS